MKQLIEDTTQLIDAKNRLVLPGFIDSHVHFNLGAITLDEISLNTATSIDEVQPRIKDYVASSHITYLVCNVKK
jgi:predicted amidohydrolase YtcJ